MFRKMRFVLKMLAGGYLLLVGVLLLQTMLEVRPSNMKWMCAVAAVFLLTGAGYILAALIRFFKTRKKKRADSDMADEDEDNLPEKTLLRDPATFRTAPMPMLDEMTLSGLSEREQNVHTLRKNSETIKRNEKEE